MAISRRTPRSVPTAALNHLLHFLDRKRWLATMNDRVAVWAHWAEIGDGVQTVHPSDAGNRDDVVDLDESRRGVAVPPREVEATDNAALAVMGQTLFACPSVPLIRIDEDGPSRTLPTNSILEETSSAGRYSGRRSDAFPAERPIAVRELSMSSVAVARSSSEEMPKTDGNRLAQPDVEGVGRRRASSSGSRGRNSRIPRFAGLR